jgi:uncharacterized protein YndB with AHSA1/START domain
MPDRIDRELLMTERIDRELVLPAPPDAVWQVITADGWLAESVELDLVPGGEARFITGDLERGGWVEEACPPEEQNEEARLVFWWSGDGEPASRVELRLDPQGEGATHLSVTESRPLEVLDVVGIPLPDSGGGSYGPSLLVCA